MKSPFIEQCNQLKESKLIVETQVNKKIILINEALQKLQETQFSE
jgi:hypothetical protein